MKSLKVDPKWLFIIVNYKIPQKNMANLRKKGNKKKIEN